MTNEQDEPLDVLYTKKYGYNRNLVERSLSESLRKTFKEKEDEVHIEVYEVRENCHDYGLDAMVFEAVIKPIPTFEVYRIEENIDDIRELKETIEGFKDREYIKWDEQARLLINALRYQELNGDPHLIELTEDVESSILETISEISDNPEYCTLGDNKHVEITKEVLRSILNRPTYLTVDNHIRSKLHWCGDTLFYIDYFENKYRCDIHKFADWANGVDKDKDDREEVDVDTTTTRSPDGCCPTCNAPYSNPNRLEVSDSFLKDLRDYLFGFDVVLPDTGVLQMGYEGYRMALRNELNDWPYVLVCGSGDDKILLHKGDENYYVIKDGDKYKIDLIPIFRLVELDEKENH